MLQGEPTFDNLIESILNFEGVESAFAGFFPGRSELGLDVVIHLNRTFGMNDFKDALDSVFDDLGPAQALFDKANETASVIELLNATQLLVSFDLSLNAGFSVNGTLTDFFSNDTSTATSTWGDLFLRIDELSASATARAADLSLELFPGITLSGKKSILFGRIVLRWFICILCSFILHILSFFHRWIT